MGERRHRAVDQPAFSPTLGFTGQRKFLMGLQTRAPPLCAARWPSRSPTAHGRPKRPRRRGSTQCSKPTPLRRLPLLRRPPPRLLPRPQPPPLLRRRLPRLRLRRARRTRACGWRAGPMRCRRSSRLARREQACHRSARPCRGQGARGRRHHRRLGASEPTRHRPPRIPSRRARLRRRRPGHRYRRPRWTMRSRPEAGSR